MQNQVHRARARNLRGAIFDQDGLLFDTEAIFQSSWIAAGRAFGVEVPEAYTHAVCGLGRGRLPEMVRRHMPALDPEAYIVRALAIASERQLSAVPAFKPGVPEILAFYRERGVKMAIASSSTREVVGHNLESSGIRPYFDAVVTGEDVANGKPAPDIFLLAAERLGLPPADCTVYEDALTGIRAAHAAGCRPVMIPDRLPPTPEIRGICEVFPSFVEVLARDRERMSP